MAIMQSVTKIKYNGEYIPAYTPFEVEEKDVSKLQQLGCHTLKQSRSKKISALDTKKEADK